MKYLVVGIAVCLLTAMAHAGDVKDFGAKGDGATDDTAAIQKALNTGGRVYLPAGKYVVRGHLDIPAGVVMEGVFQTPARTATLKNRPEEGTVLLAYEGKGKDDGEPFIQLHRCSQLVGLTVFYPEQTVPPVPYPWCVKGEGDNCTIKDVLLSNPYRAVDFGSRPCGRHLIQGLYGQVLKEGIFVDQCFDVGRIEDVHFWPFWRDQKELLDWQKENGTAFHFARTDWEFVSGCFCIAYNVGYLFTGGKDGPGNVVLTNSGSDISPCSVRVEATQGHAGVSFVNGQFMAGVEVMDTNDGPVKFTACGFWGSGQTGSHILSHSKGQLTLEGCHFISWDQENKGAPCIVADHGSLTVTGCEFLDADAGKKHFKLGGTLEAGIITSNHFHSPMQIQNDSKANLAIGLNVSPPGHN